MAPAAGQEFSLRPFAPGAVSPALRLGGRVQRQAGRLSLDYRLEGPLELVRLPPPAPEPGRRDGLWTTTCFECFLAVEGEAPYWEINLSPAGHWNLYRLEDYRTGLRPETACGALAPRVAVSAGNLTLAVRLSLPPEIPAAAPLQLGVTAVIEATAGDLSYWAVAHPGAEPDFHRRDGLVLRL